jgi:kanamycin nucleotidyltransferase
MERARSVAENALARYGANVLAIGVFGSTARGTDGPYSDLEMMIVVREPVGVRRHEFYMEGWKTEVEFLAADALLAGLHELDGGWAFSGGQFTDPLSLYDPEGFWDRVRKRAASIPDAVFREALRGAVVGDFLENFAKYRNARLRGDTAFQRLCFCDLACNALDIAGLANQTCYTSWAVAVAQSLTFPTLPDGYAPFMELFESGDLTDSSRLDAACERLAAGVVAMVEGMGIPLQVTERPI